MSRGSRRPAPFGIVAVDKPAGPTSHDVVGWIRWVLGTREVGHCGTLDPAATGVLVVCVGGATRLVPLLTADDKEYEAVFVVGASTDTLDADGEVTARAEVSSEALGRAHAEVAALVGNHQLPPPAYSAVKVDGVRAHEAARRGTPLTLEPRLMQVHEVGDVTRVDVDGVGGPAPAIRARLRVRKGTYIRSLAALVGDKAGVPCYLGGLHRTASGRVRVDGPTVLRPRAERWTPVGASVDRAGEAAPARWRLSVGDDREAQRGVVGAALEEPWSWLPIPTVRAEAAGLRPEFARLAHGQRLGAGSKLAEALRAVGCTVGDGGADGGRAKSAESQEEVGKALLIGGSGGPDDPAAILLKLEACGRICPERVIRR